MREIGAGFLNGARFAAPHPRGAPRLFSKIWSIPGVRRYHTGGSEMRAVFPIEALPAVARVIRAHRKPGIGAEVAKKIGSRTAFGGTSRGENAPSALTPASAPDGILVEESRRRNEAGV